MDACHRHPSRPAEAVCMQCRRPFCGECEVETTHGRFCGMFCAEEAQRLRVQLHLGPPPHAPLSLRLLHSLRSLATLVLLAIALYAVLAVATGTADPLEMGRQLARQFRTLFRLFF